MIRYLLYAQKYRIFKLRDIIEGRLKYFTNGVGLASNNSLDRQTNEL